MFFDHYPYTNFHNVNLDWVLQAVKAWGQTVEANDRAFRDLKEANEDFKEYVRNYLQDLDITDEINTKLDNMLASGILTPYFAPYVKGYVDSWLASHVTPTSPALDSTLTLSGAAARADSTGHRLKDLAYIDALSTPEVIASLNRSQVLPGYRVQGIAYDYNGHYYVCGGSVDETGTGVIVKMTKPDFTDAEITEIPQLGHANDITYYDGYLYVCTVGGGDAPRWGIYKINVNDFTDKTLISNAPENTIGISYRQGDFWILAPYRIYRTTDFTSYEVVVANTNDLLTAYGIPTGGRISQTIFRAAGYLIGWVCSFVFEDRHYGALTFFSASGEPIAFKMFPAYHTEIQGAVYADMSIYLLADGNMVNVFRMDPRHLSYVQLKAGDDLNSFTGRGTLYSTGSNVSAALLNSPSSGEGFTVQVDRLGVYNTIQTARTNSGRELYRIKSFNSDTWGEWIEPAAEVSQIKKDLSANFKRIIGVNNLFNSATWTTGSIDANGAIGSTSGFHYSSLIPVTAGAYTFMWTSPAVQSLIRVLGYDSDGTWVEQITNFSSGSGNTDGTRKITVGSGISYVRFSLAVGNTSLVFIDRGTTQDLFSISGGSPKVVYVAASNSIDLEKAVANYVCNGTNDELVIQTAINYANANSIGEVRLAEGDYYIDSFPRNDPSGVSIALAFGTADGTTNKACSVKLTGSGYGGIRKYGTNSEVFKGAVIHVTQNCYDSLDDTTQYAIIGVFTPSGTRVYPSVKLAVENISFKIPANQKKIICVDGWNCTAFSFDNLHCMAITVQGGSASGNISPDDLIIPVEGCIGIRGLQGDCYGVNNIWKNTFVWGFYEGFSVTGEHIIGENLGARFCNYGYTFGVCDGRRWYGSLIHPNTLINCCDELNFNLPLFGANGIYTNSIDGRQYVNLIDYNMEWRPEYSALGGDLAKEIEGYTAYGSIVYTNRLPINKETQFWETGHGKNFKTMNGIHALGGTSELRSTYIPNYMQTYYDTTLNKLLVFDGSNWRDATGAIV